MNDLESTAPAETARQCHCGAPAIDRGNGMEDICDLCLVAWRAEREPESCPCPDWLAGIRANAMSVAEYVDGVVSDDPGVARVSRTNYAYGGLLGTTLGALYELARPKPDVARLHAILRGGLASSEAIRGKLDSALAMLVEIDASRQRLASGHYLVPGEFWQGRWFDNHCACGRRFWRMGAPCLNDAEDHVRVMALPNVNSSECDCPGNREVIPVWDGRCGGCGAVLYERALASRIGAA